MPYYHCNECHHEFEGYTDDEKPPKCDWCGSDSYMLEKETPLERMCKPENMKKLLKELVAYEKGSNTRKH